jgi:transposase
VAKRRIRDRKSETLRQQGCLNPHPEKVRDPLFASGDFFDARDVVQVKYEMVRRVRVDGQPVARSAEAFGFSRPTFYLAQAALARGGLAALLPERPGPRGPHKLTADIVEFLRSAQAEEPSLGSTELAVLVEKRFERTVHPRTIERALAPPKKKRT